jgi:urea carboxylase
MAETIATTVEIIDPGIQTTVQDLPGRTGLLDKGFFPAGPLDHLGFRAANRCVGNDPHAAALEIPMGRFKAVLHADTILAVTGADGVTPALDGQEIPRWEGVQARAGQQLNISMTKGPGFRIYLAFAGGIEVPEVLGSRATYTMGELGGLEGRALRRADQLTIGAGSGQCYRMPRDLRPSYAGEWEVEVVKGPHADPDFLTSADWASFTTASWRVDLNSNRIGTQLNGPKFGWARSGGGVAGGHPSNVLDGPYPPGGVNVNGDRPVVLGPDGPTSGGFVVIATVPRGGLWKMGQCRPGRDTVRFREVDIDQAKRLAAEIDAHLEPDNLEKL